MDYETGEWLCEDTDPGDPGFYEGYCVPFEEPEPEEFCMMDEECGPGFHCEMVVEPDCEPFEDGAFPCEDDPATDPCLPDESGEIFCDDGGGEMFGICVPDGEPTRPEICMFDEECGPGFRCERMIEQQCWYDEAGEWICMDIDPDDPAFYEGICVPLDPDGTGRP